MMDHPTIERLKAIANLLPPRIHPPDHRAPREVRDAEAALIEAVSVARKFLVPRGIGWAGQPNPASSEKTIEVDACPRCPAPRPLFGGICSVCFYDIEKEPASGEEVNQDGR